MNYIILNGVNSNTITGLLIQELPPISKPLMRTQIDQIDGRDGDIVTKLGYSTVDKELSIGLHGNYDIDDVIEYFASEGTVVFSNEPDKYYRYQVLDQIDFERLVRFRTATVTMHCQPFKYELNEDPIEDAGATVETGDIVSFETQSADAVGVKVNVEPYQNLNGYDSPWVGGAGVNLMPAPTVGIVVNNSTGVISGTPTESSSSGATGYIPVDLVNNSYIFGWDSSVYTNVPNTIVYGYGSDKSYVERMSGASDNPRTVRGSDWTDASAIKYLVIKPYTSSSSYPFTQTETNNANWIMVQGTELPTSWTPYENICPITGWNGTNIYRTGKNLFIKNGVGGNTSAGILRTDNADGSINFGGTFDSGTGDAGFQIMNGIYLPKGTYTFSGVPSGGGSTTYRARINREEWNQNTLGYDTGNGFTFTLTEGSLVFVRMLVYRAMGSANVTVYPQLELGSPATDFEPYQSDTYNIPLNQTVYGGTLDVSIGLLTVTAVYHEFDGTETFNRIGSSTLGNYAYRYTVPNYQLVDSMATRASSHFKNRPVTTTNAEVGYYAYTVTGSDNGAMQFRHPDYVSATANDFKAWVLAQYNNGTPLQAYAELVTPQTYQLTPTQVKTVLGVNNIWTDSGTVDVTVPNMISVVNEGNTTARPTMTIYGSGNIGVWLNGMQVFQIALGDTGNITIDAEQMEAYQGGILRNRLVTGDYSNFVLQKGDNTISVTGNVTSVEITNYSRWL